MNSKIWTLFFLLQGLVLSLGFLICDADGIAVHLLLLQFARVFSFAQMTCQRLASAACVICWSISF